VITIVLVTGGRKYALEGKGVDERRHVYATLDAIRAHYGEIILISGGAPGLDTCAATWAEDKGVHCAIVRALWNKLGKPAGVLRNRAMAALKPDICVAFPGNEGTADMKERADKAGVRVYEV
jgi:hypothetical protein